jgi:ATP-dependent helicase/nuclease subunit A
MSPRADPKAQTAHAATQPKASVWVGANAGSGKTYVLVSRLVRLMLDGVAPERLLCLTYTRSAAAEMQERLFTLLADWALMEDAKLRDEIGARLGPDVELEDLSRARILFARALETPGGLRVQTIHAFCESLLRRFPLEAGLSPQFELLDEQDAQEIQQAIVARALVAAPAVSSSENGSEAAALQASMARLTRALSEPDLAALGRDIIARRGLLNPAAQTKNLQALAKHLNLPMPLGEPEIALEALARAYAKPAKKMIEWLAEGSSEDGKKSQGLARWIDSLERQSPRASWAIVAPIFLTDDGDLRKRLATKKTIEASPAMAAQMAAMAEAVVELRARLNATATYQMTEAIYHFAEFLVIAYEAEKRRRGVLDYDDLIGVTNHLLTGTRAAQWVLFKIDNGLEHILVDEAQDTSPAQWQVIRALADEFFVGDSERAMERTLFAVGDEKQSIFSFQGADPTEFDAQFQHFKRAIDEINGQLHYVPLTVSRRSTPQVLKFVDLVFSSPERRAGVSSQDHAIEHKAFREGEPGHVEVWPVEVPPEPQDDAEPWAALEPGAQDASTGPAILADRISAKIAELLADKTQNVSAGDILILVRTRSGFVEEMTRALKGRQIAVAGADRMVLLEQIAIMDILAALDVTLNRDDDLSLAIVLRSPLGGLSEEALYELAQARSASLWQAFEKAAREGSAAPEVKAAHARLVWLHNHIDKLAPYELLAQFLGAEHGHKLLSARLGSQIDDPIGELLRLALAYETRHAASAQGFLHWLRQGQQEIKRDMEGAGSAVRIMTVHGAKGLEAPIVFLPDTCRAPAKRGGQVNRLQFNAERLPLWRASKALLEPYGAEQVERQQELAKQEEKRLLYVALTRARDRLYIGGWLAKRQKAPPTDSWYDMMESGLGQGVGDGEEINARQWLAAGEAPLPSPEGEARDPLDEAARASVPPIADWLFEEAPRDENAFRYFGNKLFSPSALSHGDMPVTQPSGEEGEALRAASQRGKIVHKLLETLPDLDPGEREAAAVAYVARASDASDMSVDGATQTRLVGEAMAVLARPELADLFGPKSLAEASVAGVIEMLDGQKLALAGQIDRLVELPEEILLVDFKTGKPPQDREEPTPYWTQMAAYRALMQGVRPGKTIRCALIWTQTARIDWLATKSLETAMQQILSGERELQEG